MPYAPLLCSKDKIFIECLLNGSLTHIIISITENSPIAYDFIHFVSPCVIHGVEEFSSPTSYSSCEETVVSDMASSMTKLENSPPREELSSSPLVDGAGDASGVVVVVVSAGEGNESPSSVARCRLQYIMLAARVRSIFWLTCHMIEDKTLSWLMNSMLQMKYLLTRQHGHRHSKMATSKNTSRHDINICIRII